MCRRLGQRHLIVFCLFTANLVCYADRTNISVAILTMAKELNWDDAYVGLVLSSFFIGYMCTQILGGVVASARGGKHVLAWGVLLWSLFTLLTPVAATSGSTALLVAVRVAMGLAEGVAMPSIHAMVGRWIPPGERSLAISFATSGQFVGTILALACSPMAAANWPSIFYLFGAIGIVWMAIFCCVASSGPEQHRWISAAEKRYILSSLENELVGGGGPRGQAPTKNDSR